MFITSFGEQNITYRSCSNLRIHLCADVIIEKYGYKFVVQCKLYNQPVGNKAVQEVTSAQSYYEAVGAVVVTNNEYTKSARQLAESQNVWLLHDSQLAEWDSLMNDIIKKANA